MAAGPVIVMEWLGGTPMRGSVVLSMTEDELDSLKRRVKSAYETVRRYGVVHYDSHLRNTMLVDDHVMLLDWETSFFDDGKREYYEAESISEDIKMVYEWDLRD